MYRPPNWKPNPCDGCDKKEEDEYGLYCNIVCGKATAHSNYEAGADAMYEAIWEMAKASPLKTFTFDATKIHVYEEQDED